MMDKAYQGKSVSDSKASLNRLSHLVGPTKHHVYKFEEGSASDTNLLGVKGANVCEMVRMKLPVPPGFIISSETCIEYFRNPEKKKQINEQVMGQCRKAIHKIERLSGGEFFLEHNDSKEAKLPLLLAIRPSAPISMPGMMDSVLNLGINDKVVEVMAAVSNNPRWAYDTYRRFIQNFGTVVLNVDKQKYEDIMHRARERAGVDKDSLLDVDALKRIVEEFKEVALFTQDPWQQLTSALETVFYSWYAPRAVKYREVQGITSDFGTAVIVQAMVYGNLNDHSGSGVVVSRNPSTGEQEIWGEYFPNSLGLDILNGAHTPQALHEMREEHQLAYDAIIHIAGVLESRYKDVQNVQFAIQNGALYLLSTRTAKRTAEAAVHIAVSMVVEKMLTEREALLRIDPQQMSYFLHSRIDPRYGNVDDKKVKNRIIGQGVGSSCGTASGKIVFSAQEAQECRERREDCILCCQDASMDHFYGLNDANGALTEFGGMTAHAAMLMRSLNKPVITGASNLHFDMEMKELSNADGSVVLRSGDVITIDGSSGMIYQGHMPFVVAGQNDYFTTVLGWADKYKKLNVQSTVGNHNDLQKAKEFGAEGIGLYKTEHMFFHKDYVELFQQAILSEDDVTRKTFLEKLQSAHQDEFVHVFRAMDGLGSVKIRLLNRGFSAFLPDPHYAHTDFYKRQVQQIADRCGMSYEQCHERILSYQEVNPEHGLSGSRLSVIFPDIIEMQVRSIAGAILEAKKQNLVISPSIIIPQKFTRVESEQLVPLIKSICLSVCKESRFSVRFLGLTIGTMLEVPDGIVCTHEALTADGCDFVGFDTNHLTQLMFGFSKRDSELIMPTYVQKHIFAKDPFCELDVPAVGNMLQSSVQKCKESNCSTEVTVYGDHCTDKNSLRFLSHIGVDSVCCDPYLVPIAKIAAAQGKILDDASKTQSRAAHFWHRLSQHLSFQDK